MKLRVKTPMCLLLVLTTAYVLAVGPERILTDEREPQYFDGEGNLTQSNGFLSSLTGLCHFPFAFNGRTYNECTTDGGTEFYWCSQTYDFEVDLMWSICSGPGIFGFSDCISTDLINRTLESCKLLYSNITSQDVASKSCCISTSSTRYETLYCYGPLLLLPTTTVSTSLTTAPPSTTTSSSNTTPPRTTTSSSTTPPPTTTSSSSTTPPPTTTSSSSTTPPPTTTSSSSTTPPPTTTSSSSTTPPPSTTTSSSTTLPPTTTTSSSTTPPPSTTTSSSTTSPPSTTTSSSTTPPPSTTRPSSNTPPPTTTSSSTPPPSTTTSSTTPPPSTTTSSSTTPPPSTTSSTTPPPSTTTSSTTPPPTTTSSSSTTPPPTTSSTTLPLSTTTSSSTTPPPSTTTSSSTTPPPSTTTSSSTTPPLSTTTSSTTPQPSTTTSSSTTPPPSTTTSTSTTPPPSTTSSTTPPPSTTSSTTPPLSTTTSSSTTPPPSTTTSSSTKPPPSTTTSSSTTPPPSTTTSSSTTPPPSTTTSSSTTPPPTTTTSSLTTPPPSTTTSSTTPPPSTTTSSSTKPPPSTTTSSSTTPPPSTTTLSLTKPPPSTTTSSSTTSLSTTTSSTTPPPSTTTLSLTKPPPSTTSSSTTSLSTTTTSSSPPPNTTTSSSTTSLSTSTTSPLTTPPPNTTTSTTTLPTTTTSSSTTPTRSTTTSSTTVRALLTTSPLAARTKPSSMMTSSLSPVSTLLSTSISTKPNLQLWAEQASQNQLDAGGTGLLQSLWSYVTTTSAVFQLRDRSLVLYVLGNITNNVKLANLRFSMDTVNKFLLIADQLISDMSLDPSSSVEGSLGPRLLWCLENLFPMMSVTDEPFSFFYNHLDLQYTTAPCESVEDNSIIHLDATTTTITMLRDCVAGFDIKIFFITYKPQNRAFNIQYDNDEKTSYSYYLASDIRTIIVMLNNKNFHLAKASMSFRCGKSTCDQTAVCVFWNFTLNSWSSNGCITQVIDGLTQCICDHLTSFAVLMLGSVPEDSLDNTILSYITRVGLCLSSVSLLLCISIQVILLRKSKRNAAVYRHVSILHMSAFLFIFNISFLASDFINRDIQEMLCVAFTFISHFSLLGFFYWTLVQGTFLMCRLVFVFHHVTKREFLVLSIALGYACPLAIALGTFLAYFPHRYRMDETCWLDKSSGASMAFNVPTIIIMVLNFFILILVIHKLLRPSISEGKSEDDEVVKKLAKAILFCTPQFGLTWAIGIPMFAGKDDLFLQYLFVVLNPLQGFFILLFACLLDNKVMDILKKDLLHISVTSTSVSTVSST